jgi:hypothetical protein
MRTEEMHVRGKLVSRLTLLLGVTLATVSAQAGIFSFLRAFPDSPPPLFSPEVEAAISKMGINEIPVSPDCATNFVPGNDGIFRRTDYCHRANPTEPKWFLQLGYDVPAAFLKGFTEADVLARWKGVQFRVPDLLGSKVEVPSELFTSLNVTAAQTWEKILQCAGGDADLAREMYRTGVFGCSNEALIRSHLVDLRSSLPTLAASVEIAPFLDGTRVEEFHQEIQRRRMDLMKLIDDHDIIRYHLESEKLQRMDSQYWDIRMKSASGDIFEVLQKYLPSMPRMHPLLTQIMVEEFLSLTTPDESPRTVANRFKKNRAQQIYLLQLVLWLHSVEDRGCAAFGLWPSANRVAAETLSDKTIEIMNHLNGPKRSWHRNFHLVDCPSGRSVMPDPSLKMDSLLPSQQAKFVMRFNDVYTVGGGNAWRELLEVRERYITPAKP